MFNEAFGVGLQQGHLVLSHHLSGHAVLLAKKWPITAKELTAKSLPSPFHFFLLFPCSNVNLMEKTSDVP